MLFKEKRAKTVTRIVCILDIKKNLKNNKTGIKYLFKDIKPSKETKFKKTKRNSLCELPVSGKPFKNTPQDHNSLTKRVLFLRMALFL
jgi:hypothetical protein